MEPAPQITADMAARAVIAAARTYGDDPVKAFTAARGVVRRSMIPAARGLSTALGIPLSRGGRVLGVVGKNAGRSEATGGETYHLAVAAAEAAVRAAAKAPASAAPTAAAPKAERAPTPLGKVRVLTAAAARRKVLEVLQLEPSTAPDIMEILNLGEGQVRHALSELCEAREVTHTPLTAEGWRFQTWRVAS